jgi:hypothetical protein
LASLRDRGRDKPGDDAQDVIQRDQNPLSVMNLGTPDTRHRRGAGGSHQADRVSAVNLTESRCGTEAVKKVRG